jgi:poly(3-hydroxybutyrate) depolymerase
MRSASNAVHRRAFLGLVGAATAGVALAGCSSAERGAPDPLLQPTPTFHPTTTFRSKARRGQSETYQVVLPPGVKDPRGLPVCLVLHGRGDNHRAAVHLLHLDRALATITDNGAPPIALVAMDGGDHSYWHRRADGDDPQQMLIAELLPRLAVVGLQTSRIALFARKTRRHRPGRHV